MLKPHPFFLLFLLSVSSLTFIGSTTSADHGGFSNPSIVNIGVVLDHCSRIGKEAKTAIEMAKEDILQTATPQQLLLHFRDSHENPFQLASTVLGLIEEQQVEAVVGSLTWSEAAMIVNASQRANNIPLLSFVASALPYPFVFQTRPPVIQIATDVSSQLNCIAAIIGSYRWRKVIAIYQEDTYSDSSGIINLLSDSLRAVGSEIEHRSALPQATSPLDPRAAVRRELEKLRHSHCKVFIVAKSSLPMVIHLFDVAKELGMMSKGHVWVINDDVASLLDSVGPAVISSSMQGVIGIKTHFSETTDQFKDFSARFRKRFRSEYPDEDYQEPGIYALRAYDAVRAVAGAAAESAVKLTDGILSGSFSGLSGRIELTVDGGLKGRPAFRIVNVVGKSYMEIGFWSERVGFYRSGTEGRDGVNANMESLGEVFWPGGCRRAPTGWTAEGAPGADGKVLRIGVPARGAFTQFVNVSVAGEGNGNGTLVSGFSVDVFKAAVKRLPYRLAYQLVPYYGSYDGLIEQVDLKVLDAVVGDVEIMAYRYQLAEFTQPYMDSGLVMLVRERRDDSFQKVAFKFMHPFTPSMWVFSIAMCIFTGFVVSLIERGVRNQEFSEGTASNQIGTMLWFSFSTFFYSHREPLKSNLSRMVVVTWLFVVLILNSAFTANLTSMLTLSQLKPSPVDVQSLKRSGAMVGCNGNSFIVHYLIEVVGFSPASIVKVASIDEYPKALSTGRIAAAFFVEPHAKVFLSYYCQGFTISGPSYKLGGFGFVFPKGSPLTFDISEAILQASETGEIQRLEKSLLQSSNCSRLQEDDNNDNGRLGPSTFRGLFLVTGLVSVIALLISFIPQFGKVWLIGDYLQEALIRRRTLRWSLGLLGGRLP